MTSSTPPKSNFSGVPYVWLIENSDRSSIFLILPLWTIPNLLLGVQRGPSLAVTSSAASGPSNHPFSLSSSVAPHTDSATFTISPATSTWALDICRGTLCCTSLWENLATLHRSDSSSWAGLKSGGKTPVGMALPVILIPWIRSFTRSLSGCSISSISSWSKRNFLPS